MSIRTRLLMLVLAALGTGCAALGGRLYDANQGLQRRNAGLEEKHVNAGGLDIAYADGGTGDPIVFVHGFSGDRTNWYPMAKYLVGEHRVIALDLPPFGDSAHPPAPSCTVDGHVEHLHAFVEALGLERFHLVGNSMGGHTAALYAARHADRVKTLALVDAAGVTMPVKSEGMRLLESGTNGFVVHSEEDVDRMMHLLFVDQPPLPPPLRRYMAQKESARSADIQRWFTEYTSHNVPMEPLLPSITMPTLVLWGEQDRVLDVSMVGAWRRGLPDATAVVMRAAGHVPMMERPDEAAAHYRRFLAAHAPKGEMK